MSSRCWSHDDPEGEAPMAARGSITDGVGSHGQIPRLESVGVFGLGEAGSEIASGLVEHGVSVRAYDPAPVPTPVGVQRHSQPAMVVREVDYVLAVTAAHDAERALRQAIDGIREGTQYVDLSTSSPHVKRTLGAIADEHNVSFVDVALMATVPGRGIRAPQYASGATADLYARTLTTVGTPVTVVGAEPGAAATHKLLRSILTKGLGALLLEAQEAGRAAGLENWLWSHLVSTVEDADEAFMSRLMAGMSLHAVRRHEEMQASAALLRELGVTATMTTATESVLRKLAATNEAD